MISQKIKQQPAKEKNHLIFYLFALTGLFLSFEVAVFIQGNELYLRDYKYVAKHLTIPLKVMPAIAGYILVQLVLHILYVIYITGVTLSIAVWYPFKKKTIETLGISLWVLGIINILLLNQYLFPHSKFSFLTSLLITQDYLKMVFGFFISLFCVAQLISFLGLIKLSFSYKKISLSLLVMLFSFLFFKNIFNKKDDTDYSSITKPNIILIGIDALRPDFLGFFGGSKTIAPRIDHFLEGSTVFSESLTPLARTFPAWVSILTGQYPKVNSIRTDLSSIKHLAMENTLSNILKKEGYATIFATDESRYSNIDQNFGFETLITPPQGFNDFLLGTINDFPLSNLLVNTYWGYLFLPFNYANRANYITYNPNTFLNYLNRVLNKKKSKPTFLSIHFCLVHYPYAWAKNSWDKSPIFNYKLALNRIDDQFNQFLEILKHNQLLEHAVVILLSDHGESMALAGDRITDADYYHDSPKKPPIFYPSNAKVSLNKSIGHGTDVLSLSQYHNLLAFRFYGLAGQRARIVSGPVSLLDIKPSLLQLLKYETTQEMHGESLLPYIAGNKEWVSTKKDFFIESDFSPDAVHSVHPETRDILFQGIDYFQIDPKTTKLSVKSDMLKLIISSKQYADIYDSWILALYPKDRHLMQPILVNLETGEWTDNLQSRLAKSAPTIHMLNALKNFFKEDIKEVINNS